MPLISPVGECSGQGSLEEQNVKCISLAFLVGLYSSAMAVWIPENRETDGCLV